MTEPTQKPAALIDAGWAALAAGDTEHAVSAVEAALARKPRSVSALCLKAAIEVSRGSFEEAMAVCRQAMDIDSRDPRPFIQAAEIELYSENDEEAIPLALQAIDRASEEPDFIDAMLIKAAAEIGCTHDEEAERTLRELESCSIDEPPLLYRLGQLWLELDQPERASRAFRECIARDSDVADAHHGLGLAQAALGRDQEMLASWRRVHELDDRTPLTRLHTSAEELEDIALAAIAELPEPLHGRLSDAAIVVEPRPPTELVDVGIDPRAVARFDDRKDGLRIHLYHHNLERVTGSRGELEDELELGLVTECAELFDLSEAELADLGLL